MKRRRLIVLLLSGAAFAAAPGRAEDVAVTLRERSVYEVEGSFQAPVPPPVAWAVLTDYERIGEFVPAVKRSRVIERRAGEAVLLQDGATGWMVFSRRVALRLQVREEPPGRITFQDLSGKDFASYAGGWTLEERAGGTFVTYRLRAEPKFHVPAFIVRGVLKREAQDLLRGIRGEMVRRNGGAS